MDDTAASGESRADPGTVDCRVVDPGTEDRCSEEGRLGEPGMKADGAADSRPGDCVEDGGGVTTGDTGVTTGEEP
jgi:hypothetical protein